MNSISVRISRGKKIILESGRAFSTREPRINLSAVILCVLGIEDETRSRFLWREIRGLWGRGKFIVPVDMVRFYGEWRVQQHNLVERAGDGGRERRRRRTRRGES